MTNGNILTARLDPDELGATVIQTFPMAHDHGVLRRTVAGAYQLKFYDRFSILSLPPEPQGYHIANSEILSDGDLVLFLDAPRPGCPQHGYVFLIGRDDASSRQVETHLCQPLATVTDPAHDYWLLRSVAPLPGSPVWIVQNGALYLARDTRQASGMVAGTGGAAVPVPWHIENGPVSSSDLERRSSHPSPVPGAGGGGSTIPRTPAAPPAPRAPQAPSSGFSVPSEVEVVSMPTERPVLVHIR